MKNIKKFRLIVIGIITISIFVLTISLKKTAKEKIQVSNDIKNTYKILVDVEDSKLYLFENEIMIKEYKCSGGKWSTPSPIGTWIIIQKARWGEGFGR